MQMNQIFIMSSAKEHKLLAVNYQPKTHKGTRAVIL